MSKKGNFDSPILCYGTPKWSKSKNSIGHISKPEVVFDAVPTAFFIVPRPLKGPLIKVCKFARQMTDLETPKFWGPISRNFLERFFLKFLYLKTSIISSDLQRKKKSCRLKKCLGPKNRFFGWGALSPLGWPLVPNCWACLVGPVEPQKTSKEFWR